MSDRRTTRTINPCNLPNWTSRVHLFDGLEISPCVTIRNGTGKSWIEVCDDPAAAEFWSVYGHYNPAMCNGFGGVDCLEDFATEADARSLAEKLCKRYAHLRQGGGS